MPFPMFWCGFLCMEQLTNEKKISRILVKQNVNRKVARLLSKNCLTNCKYNTSVEGKFFDNFFVEIFSSIQIA